MPATYRYEVAKTGRAGCQVSHESEEAKKIPKDTLRFGSLVTIKEHTTWKWKHWGCVTPAQVGNILEQIGGLEGLDLETDLDILDGYEELPDWAQDKVKYALKHGHVHNDDWNGDPERNVPGAKGIRKRTPKKKVKKDSDGDEEEEASPVPIAKAKRGRPKKAIKDEDEDSEEDIPKKKRITTKKRKADVVDDDKEDSDEVKPKKKRAGRPRKAVVKDEDSPSDDPLSETKPPVKDKSSNKREKVGRAKSTKAVKEEFDTEPEPTPTKPRSRKVKAEPVNEADLSSVKPHKATENKKSRQSKKVKEEAMEDTPGEEIDDAEPSAPEVKAARGRPKKVKEEIKEAELSEEGNEQHDAAPKIGHGRSRRKPKA